MIAESDKSFAADFKNMLEKNGGSVCKIVNDGIDAVSECFELNPDIVFVDKNLSFLNGFKTAEKKHKDTFCSARAHYGAGCFTFHYAVYRKFDFGMF